MKRSISKDLILWKKKKSRKPLIIRGARQVGKTYSIEEFGRNSFNSYVKIDFEKHVRLRSIFEKDLDPQKIIDLISLEVNEDIIPEETLLFFDEIQFCPRALSALRYFYEDLPKLHIIAAGSLLEFEMEKISFPVGRVEFMYMYPITFEEFLINNGQKKLNNMRPRLFSLTPLDDFLHNKLLDCLKTYFLIGGMPEAVKVYIETKSLSKVAKIHEDLLVSFIQDILKYEKYIENDLIREILEMIPKTIGGTVKYSKLTKNASAYKIKQVLTTLEKTFLISIVKSSSAAGLPLGGNINKSSFKLCFLDIGLMQNLCGISAIDLIASEDLAAAYKGGLCEQFIGQELKAYGGSQNNHLYYWARAKQSSNAEIDYLITDNGQIFPIEIKNSKSGRLKSLHLFLEEHPEISTGLVLNSGNIGIDGKLHFMPLYTKLRGNKSE